MHKECVTPGFGDSCICPECIERVKKKARRCWTQGCDNILTTAFVFCKECTEKEGSEAAWVNDVKIYCGKCNAEKLAKRMTEHGALDLNTAYCPNCDREPQIGIETEQAALRMGPEGSKILSGDDLLLDRITALEASVAVLGKASGEHESNIRKATDNIGRLTEGFHKLLDKMGIK